ncbi:hypothetical protein LTS18_010240 [Coniosporium uncinatum]|uniref:Uncharacterized protein n=1 Tax=Coniosporium uncinatum TaxID=93489 RepID=A0ACC3CZN9_9PEZI|nr:hypothetical protein LTS18_010240 [Coniosporium uncinatum]
MSQEQVPMPLDCAIIGAGIAGLAAGIAVTRAGYKATVYKRSHSKNKIDAAISLTHNSNHVLKRWGFDFAKAGETEKKQYRKVTWDTVEILVQDYGLADIEKIYGAEFNAYHRVALHNGIRELAEHEGVHIKLGHDVDDLDVEAGTNNFKDGSAVQTDLIIIADGIKSPFVHKSTGHPLKHSSTGRSVFRTLTPINKLIVHPVFRPLYEDEPSGFVNSSISPTGVFIVTYPCRNDTLINLAMFHKTLPSQNRRDSAFEWNAGGDLEDAKKLVED